MYRRHHRPGFLVNSGVSCSDFIFAERLFGLEQRVPDALKLHPEIQNYTNKIYGHSTVKEAVLADLRTFSIEQFVSFGFLQHVKTTYLLNSEAGCGFDP